MRNTIGLLLSCLFTVSALGQEVRFVKVQEIDEYQTVLEILREKEHMLMVALHDGGGRFKKMHKDGIFTNTAVAEALKGYTAVAIDIRDEMGARWVSLFPVDDLPGFFFLNEEEFLLAEAEGYLSADSLVNYAQTAREERHLYDTLVKGYNDHELTDAQWRKLLDFHSLNFNFSETASIAWEHLNNHDSTGLFNEEVAPVLAEYGVDLETRYPGLVIRQREALKKVYPDFDFEDFFERAYSYNLDLAILNEDSGLVEQIESKLVPHDVDAANDPGELTLATYKLYAEETENFDMWVRGAEKASKRQPSNEKASEMLFEEGFEIADNYNSRPAVKAAHSLAKMSNEYRENYRSTMLQAYSSYLLESYERALSEVQRASELASDSKESERASNLMKMIEKDRD